MNKTVVSLALIALFPVQSLADDRVLPAQADDIARAEANLGAAAKDKRKNTDGDKGKPSDNFGATVSQEAKALKDADKDTRKQFGQSVAARRRNSHAQPPANAGGSSSNSNSAGGPPTDPLSHVPPQGSASAGRPVSPGQGHRP